MSQIKEELVKNRVESMNDLDLQTIIAMRKKHRHLILNYNSLVGLAKDSADQAMSKINDKYNAKACEEAFKSLEIFYKAISLRMIHEYSEDIETNINNVKSNLSKKEYDSFNFDIHIKLRKRIEEEEKRFRGERREKGLIGKINKFYNEANNYIEDLALIKNCHAMINRLPYEE